MKGGKIIILGAGISGVGSAILAKKKGFEVFVSDQRKIEKNNKKVLLQHGIDFEEGTHNINRILDANEVIKSPGISSQTELIREICKKNIPIISEIEFAGRYTNAFKICISGSNGKTTTSLLTYHILKSEGLNVGLAGNVGKSFALQVAENIFDYYVLELSSFQLDGMFDFKADIAILLNITPDHLDRYDNDFKKYINSKFRILQNQRKNDAFIFCFDDPILKEEVSKRKIISQIFPFTFNEFLKGEGAFVKNNELRINVKSKIINMTLEELALQGKHNVYNSMAASVAAKLIGIRKNTIRQCLSDFQNVEHRLEYVATIHGVEFINDSKATNVNSTWYALESIEGKIIWIVGGIDKGNDYNILKSMVKDKVKAIVCLGVDNQKIYKSFADVVQDIYETRSAEEAVKTAYSLANHGDTVLLSPACASFDLFENFEDRGTKFKKAVNQL